MKQLFDRLSVANKLVLINLIVVIAALASALLYFVISERSEHREHFIDDLRIQSRMMAQSLLPTLKARDTAQAQHLLNAYSVDKAIIEVIVFDVDRQVIAYYNREGKPLAETDYAYLYGGRLQRPGDN